MNSSDDLISHVISSSEKCFSLQDFKLTPDVLRASPLLLETGAIHGVDPGLNKVFVAVSI